MMDKEHMQKMREMRSMMENMMSMMDDMMGASDSPENDLVNKMSNRKLNNKSMDMGY